MTDPDSVPVFRRGPTPTQYAENLEWFTSEREAALRVGCRDCHAPAGQRCVIDRSGRLLTKFPAHPRRIKDAQKMQEAV